jgi:hypothetical protein
VRAGSLSIPDPNAPELLTEAAAAPPGVPGPFRLISASSRRLLLERRGLKLDIRKLDPEDALRRFRAGKLDEAPVPLGDIQALLRDPRLDVCIHLHRLLGVDVVVARKGGALDRFPKVRHVYDDTADRADYQALVPELEAPPAENLSPPPRGAKIARAAALAFSRARKQIGSLPKVAVRFAQPADPSLAYGEHGRPPRGGRQPEDHSDLVGRRRPPRLAAPQGLARGRPRRRRLHASQIPGVEPVPVTSNFAVAAAGTRTPFGYRSS